MITYKNLTSSEKKHFKRYLLRAFRYRNIRHLNNKNIAANKVVVLIDEFKILFKKDPLTSFYERYKSKVSQKQGYVYVIGNLNANICKIGFSINPKERIKGIQTGCPHFLQILLLFEADKYTETRLHHKYKKYKRTGEWFNIAGELKESIEKHIKLQPTHV